MSEQTRQLAQYAGGYFDIDSLSDDDEMYDKQIYELFSAIDWKVVKLEPSSFWKTRWFALANSLGIDNHPQADRFAGMALGYVCGNRAKPISNWINEFIKKIANDPNAIVPFSHTNADGKVITE